MPQREERILILGAAGRDFHNFNTVYRNDPQSKVVGFTATQIPGIDSRRYPKELSGPLYPEGLPIWSEDDMEQLIKEQAVDRCILAYSDLHEHTVADIEARTLVAEADFGLLCPERTMLKSSKPVVAITAVRTGCGKSQTSHYVIAALKELGKKTVLVRHPMPYGELAKQAVQRFASYDDLDKHDVTIEEREEYEQHIAQDTIVYAGVDYEAILRQAEKECDIIIWDGGNNDTPFYKSDLWIVVADPHRAGHELTYHPGNVNFRAADIITINKANTAPPGTVESIQKNAEQYNPKAMVFVTDSVVTVDKPELVKGKKAVVVEDGPTLTHGGMSFGAGMVAAEKCNAQVIDPHPYLKGSIARTANKYRHIGKVIPAMGYSHLQVKDLEKTIDAVPADVVVIGTPMNLQKLIQLNKPSVVVRYRIEDRGDKGPFLRDAVKKWVENGCKKMKTT